MGWVAAVTLTVAFNALACYLFLYDDDDYKMTLSIMHNNKYKHMQNSTYFFEQKSTRDDSVEFIQPITIYKHYMLYFFYDVHEFLFEYTPFFCVYIFLDKKYNNYKNDAYLG